MIFFVGEYVVGFWVLASGKKKFKFVTENVHGHLGMTNDVFNPLVKRFACCKDAEDFAIDSCSSASKAVSAAIAREIRVTIM